jgi:hypothetical protein
MSKLSTEPTPPAYLAMQQAQSVPEPTSVTPISTVMTTTVTGGTLPIWLQGNAFGIKKIYAYPLLFAIGAVLLMGKSSSIPTRRVSMQPA